MIQEGLPVWGTCAGMILLAKNIENEESCHLAVMDITVKRNGYGTQLDSFNTKLLIEEVSTSPIYSVSILTKPCHILSIFSLSTAREWLCPSQ